MSFTGDLGARAVSGARLDAYLTVSIVFQLIGLCGCTLMFLTALFSSNAPRRLAWFSFIFGFVISTTSYCLLFFSGNLHNPLPPYSLCLTQAALIYAAPILTAATTVVLVVQIYFDLSSMMTEGTVRGQKYWSFSLLASPYLLYFSMAIGCLVAGLRNPDIVQKSAGNIYCNFTLRIPSRIASITVALLLIPTIAFEIRAYFLFRKSWASMSHRQIPLWTILRVFLFSLVAILWMGLGFAFVLMKNRDPEFNVILSTVPISAVIIFGTQTDLLKPWMFWERDWDVSLWRNTSKRSLNSRTRLSSNSTGTL